MDETPVERQRPARSTKSVVWTAVGALIVIVATVLYVFGVMYKPAYSDSRSANSAITVSTTSSGEKMYTVHLAIQQAVGLGPHADWLGYQTDRGPIHPGTIFTLPPNALVTVVVRNFDSRTPLRNTFFTLVQGTIGGVEYVNGKKVKVMNPDLTSHTFTIPDFHVSVPMEGIPDSGKPSFETMRFSFRTPNRKGVYRWQCIVPCGSGLYGFGGPMHELGYMQGLITIS